LVAIVIPDKVELEKWAKENEITGTYSDLLANEKTVKLF
jgi:long-subunit acyl-CoA synthetase (AMP-forming)